MCCDMRLVYVGHGLSNPKPGAQTSTRRLLDEIMAADTDLDVITIPSSRTNLPSSFERSFRGTPVHHLQWFRESSKELRRICRHRNVDLINIHTYGGYTTSPPANVPTIVTPHDEPILTYHDFISPPHLVLVDRLIKRMNLELRSRVVKRCNHAIALSSKLADQMIELGMPQNRITVIPNGFKTVPEKGKTSRKMLLSRFGLPMDSVIVLSVGATIFGKGIHRIVQAARYLLHIDPRIHFIHVGKTKNLLERRYVNALERRYELSTLPNMHFIGPMHSSDLLEALRCYDAYFSASYSEGCSQALMEAMSARLPIVSTDVGAAKDLLGDE